MSSRTERGVYPDAGSGVSSLKVTFPTADFPPDPSDPIVTTTNPIRPARIAFWTDDETCKVNLNTAGEGAYWDWPKAATQDEMQFSGNPPAKDEFYRISGHPASTSLSAIFPDLMPGTAAFRWVGTTTRTNPGGGSAASVMSGPYISGLKAMLGGDASGNYASGVAPRYSFGTGTFTGSQGGTFPVPYNQTYPPAQLTNLANGSVYGQGTVTFTDPRFSGLGKVPSTRTAPSRCSTRLTRPPQPRHLGRPELYATPDELFFHLAQTYPNKAVVSPTPALGTYENPALYNTTAASSNLTTALTALQVAQRGFSDDHRTSKAPGRDDANFSTRPASACSPLHGPMPNTAYETE